MNIAEILKDKPKGTKLYSPLCGNCYLERVHDNEDIEVTISYSKDTSLSLIFNKEGRSYLGKTSYISPYGEYLLFPSNEMRNWNKFTWKKGDILVSLDGTTESIFKEYVYDTYNVFIGIHCFNSKTDNKEYIPETSFSTNVFRLQDPNLIPCYINTIEERFNGKLNMETLEIEKAQPEFKDGDIVAVDLWRKNIRIFKEKENGNNVRWGKYYIGFSFNNDGKLIQTFENYRADCSSDRLATDEEKQQLFSALAKEGKAWDAEKKQIVDLKPKINFKPFDKVLVRNTDTEEWFPGFFEKFDSIWDNPYHIMNRRNMTDFAFKQCIPYEGNEHLLGTTKNVKE